jgi:hypothetical protein
MPTSTAQITIGTRSIIVTAEDWPSVRAAVERALDGQTAPIRLSAGGQGYAAPVPAMAAALAAPHRRQVEVYTHDGRTYTKTDC